MLAGIALGMVIGGQINVLLLSRWTEHQLLVFGLLLHAARFCERRVGDATQPLGQDSPRRARLRPERTGYPQSAVNAAAHVWQAMRQT